MTNRASAGDSSSGARRIGKSIVALVAAAGLTLGAGALAANADPGNGNSNPGNKISICHATSSVKNPWVFNSPNANGVVSGHAGASHQDGRDIIPSFWYNSGGEAQFFPGQNWDAAGQAIFNNGCEGGSPVG